MTLRSFLFLTVLAATANALQCDCGYIDPLDPTGAVYTSFFETNFNSGTKLSEQYRILNTALTKNNALGRSFSPNNVALDDEGAKLTVSAYKQGQKSVYGAELETKQNDLWYGSYHVTARLPTVPGTVSAFFAYKSDSNEIDIEYVSKSTSSPMLFSVKPQQYDANHQAMDSTFVSVPPPQGTKFSADFHTYSFTWTPSAVTFFVDGDQTRHLTTNVPKLPCVLAINHWSDGNPNYSGGPPTVDTVLTVQRVWAYYNSSTGGGMKCVNSKSPCRQGATVLPTVPQSHSTTKISTHTSATSTLSHNSASSTPSHNSTSSTLSQKPTSGCKPRRRR